MQTKIDKATVWAERYRILECLGENAGRQTFLAVDLATEERVVLKRLLLSKDFQWQDLKLFQREIEVLKQLSHPSIPRYLDAFEIETSRNKGFVLVQTYIPARSLSQQLVMGRRFSEVQLRYLAEQLLDILIYLQAQTPAVIHRDIKPSNILLSESLSSQSSLDQSLLNQSRRNGGENVYLVDFGAVQSLLPTPSGTITVVGTYGYMPPEQFGGKLSLASDLYSLGATLIHLATGSPPADLPQRELRIQFEDQVSLSQDLVRWLQTLTQPSPSQRYGSALEAKQALQGRGNFVAIAPTNPSQEIVETAPGGGVVWREMGDRVIVELAQPSLQTIRDWVCHGVRAVGLLLFGSEPQSRRKKPGDTPVSKDMRWANRYFAGMVGAGLIGYITSQIVIASVTSLPLLNKLLLISQVFWILCFLIFFVEFWLRKQRRMGIKLPTATILQTPHVAYLEISDTQIRLKRPGIEVLTLPRSQVWQLLHNGKTNLVIKVESQRIQLALSPVQLPWLGERLSRVLNQPLEKGQW